MELNMKELRTLNIALQTAEYAMLSGFAPGGIEDLSQISMMRERVKEEQKKLSK